MRYPPFRPTPSPFTPQSYLLMEITLQRFQKEAIYRQMQEYKREKNTLESRLNEMIKKTKDHDDHLRSIDAWLKQVRYLLSQSTSILHG